MKAESARPLDTNSSSEVADANARPALPRESRLPLSSPEHEDRNFIALAAYQIAMRIGWIFKTESIVMPAFLDLIAGPGWVRGFLPMLNRFGQSVPPILFARRLKVMSRKKWALFAFSSAMGVVFLSIALLWALGRGRMNGWLPAAFLTLYGIFFACTGLAQLANGTLQGKLVRIQRRGRLLMVATTIGAALAILAAWSLLDRWLAMEPPGFGFVFGFTGVFFLISSLCVTSLAEDADNHAEAAVSVPQIFFAAGRILYHDHDFRRLTYVAMLFSTVLLLFPHYQALGRERLGIGLEQLMLWVVVQNTGTGLMSILAGPLADRRGNRLVLRLAMFGSAISPLLAVLLAGMSGAASWYWMVFAMIGLTPIVFRTLANYTLELSSHDDHPRYLSTLSLCIAVPFFFSPLVGWLVDVTSFEAVMFCGAALILTGAVLTFWLHEPRHVHHPEIAEITIDNIDIAPDN